tara:strand:+ start:75 stop:467 length:393 start_codon:yes stop_codon:yes gene_type:complete
MILKRFIIWTIDLETSTSVINSIKDFSTTTILVSDSIVCIETELTNHEIESKIDPNIEIGCVELDIKLIKKLVNSKFKPKEKVKFDEFMTLTFKPNTINEFLDLILSKGGVDNLHQREVEGLDALTNKPI